jgi:predicted Zn-dependent peptidase
LQYADEINALTIGDVRDAVRAYLDPDALIVSVAGVVDG